jgi:hypothetical protein
VNEHSFIKSFHKKLDPSIKIWKIYDPYQGGVPDALLFGCNGQMLFVEYKYVKALPKRDTTIIKPALSAQQSEWLKDKIARNIDVLVVLGTQDGVVLFRAPCEWDDGIPRSDAGVLTPRQAAGTIALLLGVEDSARRVEIQGVSKDAV